MSIDMDVNMVAVVGRRPFSQVLRNSLSGHPPTTGHETLSRDRTPVAVMLRVVVSGEYYDSISDYLARDYLRAILSLLQSQQSPQLSVLSSQQWCPHLTPSLSSFAQSHKLFFLLLS